MAARFGRTGPSTKVKPKDGMRWCKDPQQNAFLFPKNVEVLQLAVYIENSCCNDSCL